jgi:hypothetical protein
MNMDSSRALPPRRRDDESDWHDLVSEICPHCGCEFFVAKDDPSIVWDPGRAWEDSCHDRACHCHTEPVIGARRSPGPTDPGIAEPSDENG